MEEQQKAKGIWDSTEPYAQKVKFETDQPVLITFPQNFERPQEFPGTNPEDSGFCVFNILAGEDQKKSSIMTSSVTMLRNLKAHEPLAGQSLTITKKNVGGKTFYYVESAEQFAARTKATPIPEEVVELEDNAGVDSQGNL